MATRLLAPMVLATADPGVGNDSAHGILIGMWWMNTTSGSIFRCTSNAVGAATWATGVGATGPAGADGTNGTSGTNGTNGATWFTGSGVPSSGTGVNGDLYLNTATGDIYKKVSGAWGSPISTLTGGGGGGTADPTDVNLNLGLKFMGL